MTHRMNNLAAAALRITGIASMVAFVGAAAAAPRAVIIAVSGGHQTALVAMVAPIASAAPVVAKPVVAATPVELLRDVTQTESAVQAVAVVGPRVHTMRMEVTGYCACTKCCGENAQGITASGRDVSYNNSRFVAADTTVLPFHTKLIIPGYHNGATVEVIDRGGAIKGNKLDLYFTTHEEALEWGRKFVDVTVVD